MPPSPPPQSPPPSAPPCTYTLVSDTLSWHDANAACQAAGLQLASVQSAEQNALLLTVAGDNEVWIGGTDAASEGAWVWSPSDTPLSYTNWGSGEPNNYYYDGRAEDCLVFSWLGRRAKARQVERPALRFASQVRLPDCLPCAARAARAAARAAAIAAIAAVAPHVARLPPDRRWLLHNREWLLRRRRHLDRKRVRGRRHGA